MDVTTTRLKKARTQLLCTTNPDLVFCAHLAVVPDRIDETVETACTDGTVIRWNPEFVAGCSDKELFGVLVHELLHVGLLHTVTMRNYRDHELANVAADLAINGLLWRAGVELPENGCFPGEGQFDAYPVGKSMEEYYRLLSQATTKPQGGKAAGEIEPAGSDAQRTGQDQSVVIAAVEQIRAQAKHAADKAAGIGSVSSSMKGAIQAATERKIDFRSVLREFRTKLVRGGSDWSRPNRRLRAAGIAAPRNKTREVGDVVVLLDCSGSMTAEVLERCLAEIKGLFGSVAGTVHVWQHDTEVVRKDKLEQGKPIPPIKRATAGGTSHVRLFDAIEEAGIRPSVVVCLTDCITRYPVKKPAMPVVWIADGPVSSGYKPPFGKLTGVCF